MKVADIVKMALSACHDITAVSIVDDMLEDDGDKVAAVVSVIVRRIAEMCSDDVERGFVCDKCASEMRRLKGRYYDAADAE